MRSWWLPLGWVALCALLFFAWRDAHAQPVGEGWQLCASLGESCDRGEGAWEVWTQVNEVDWETCSPLSSLVVDTWVQTGPISVQHALGFWCNDAMHGYTSAQVHVRALSPGGAGSSAELAKPLWLGVIALLCGLGFHGYSTGLRSA